MRAPTHIDGWTELSRDEPACGPVFRFIIQTCRHAFFVKAGLVSWVSDKSSPAHSSHTYWMRWVFYQSQISQVAKVCLVPINCLSVRELLFAFQLLTQAELSFLGNGLVSSHDLKQISANSIEFSKTLHWFRNSLTSVFHSWTFLNVWRSECR